MLSLWMILISAALLCSSGVPGCLLPARPLRAERSSALFMVLGSMLGLAGIAAWLESAGGAATPVLLVWPAIFSKGHFAVSLDAISVIALVPVLVVPMLGAIYGIGYSQRESSQREFSQAGNSARSSRRLALSYGLLAGSMVLVTIARDAVLFLIAWELMAIAGFFASTADEDDPAVRHAGWVYLVAAHMGMLCLIAMFALWRHATGSFALEYAHGIPAGVASALFVLAVIGFGFKAGIVPLHVWLPGAHANAPSHVSAVMSGVMLKMGMYGIVRMTMLLPHAETWWGGALLAAGVVTSTVGITFAIGQHDLKRLLAYSSIENIGIIVIGLGLALLGRGYDRPDWILLGLAGAFLHVWNHSLFKPLLFFGAGAIIHATGTRELDQLGGLAKRMPWVAILFTVGAIAICALPPLNGFASEWLLYMGLFRTAGIGGDGGLPAAAPAAVMLALAGALAVACFVKLLGTVFLGAPRTGRGDHAHDPPASMLVPMVLLAAGCVLLGLFPEGVARLLERAAGTWSGAAPESMSPAVSSAISPAMPSLASIAPLACISNIALAILAVAAAVVLALRLLPRASTAAAAGTWDCGYARPAPRMQYSGSSLSQSLVGLFSFITWPAQKGPAIRELFSGGAAFRSFLPDVVLDRLVLPCFHVAGRYVPWVRVFQRGQTHHYVLYILVIVIVLFVWGSIGVER